MKNPVSVILIAAAIMMFFNGAGLFVPAIMMFIAFNIGQKSNKKQKDYDQPRGRGNRYDPYQKRRQQRPQRDFEQRRRPSPPPPKPRKQPKPRPKPNPYKNSGVEKYKDFDYEGAIEDFKKSIEINPGDIPTHFNIACAYSLTEQKDLAYRHLDRAVSLGYKDFERIKTHDAFAYIRIQNDFGVFEKNGFRLSAKMDIPQDSETVDPLLLERLKKLSELRDRGILTEAEFLVQKEKLLR